MKDEEYMIRFGERVKQRRKELKLTQTELGEKIGYSGKSMISYIEAGKKNCNSSLIAKLANALECEPAYLMGWEDPVDLYDEKNDMLIEFNREVKGMSDDMLERLMKYVILIKRGDL